MPCRFLLPVLPAIVRPLYAGDVMRHLPRAANERHALTCQREFDGVTLNKAALVATKPIANEREAQLKALGSAFEEPAKETQCEFVSLFGAVPESTMVKDGVHPDAAGHAAMAEVLMRRLLS